MTPIARPLAMAAALAVLLYLIPTTNHAIGRMARPIGDVFDPRPTETILLLGNSRTYNNYMPEMIREMADSAQAPTRYDIVMEAWAGASFESLWQDPDVRQSLSKHWDQIVLQAESRAHFNQDLRESFANYGAKLIAAANASHSPVAIIVGWVYSEDYIAALAREAGVSAAGGRAWYLTSIQNDHLHLAQRTGAKLINTGAVWEIVLHKEPAIQLYRDGNHPSVAGSYLSALMIYAAVSGKNVGDVTYVPDGMDEATADKIKAAMQGYL